MNLDNKKWREFKVKEIFEIEKCKCSNASILKDGDIPYVGATNRNNGVMKFVERKERWITKGNCIVFICDGQGSVGYSLFKQEDFIGSTTLKIGRNAFLNKYTAQFLISSLDKNRNIYSYGYKRKESRLLNETILLPVDNKGEPDYKFMESYIVVLENQKREKYHIYNQKRLSKIDYKVIPALDEKQWKSFFINEIFMYKKGNQNNMLSLMSGDFPLISAKKIDNACKGFVCCNNKDNVFNGNCITINNDGDGGAGLAFYQPYQFLLDSHCTALIANEKLSFFVLLFISKCISLQNGRFGHGHSINSKRIEKFRFMLPINKNGLPDYLYMEQYIKNTIFKKFENYANFTNKFDIS